MGRVVCAFAGLASAMFGVGVPAYAGDDRAETDTMISLAPTSPWVLDLAEENCSLRRTFTNNEVDGWLEFRRHGPGAEFELKIIVRGLGLSGNGADLRFTPDNEYDDFSAPPAVAFDGGLTGFVVHSISLQEVSERRRVHQSTVEAFEANEPYDPPNWGGAQQTKRAGEIEAFEVRNGFDRDVRFEIGAMGKTMTALDTCMDELLTIWGIDPELSKSLAQRAKPINLKKSMRQMAKTLPFHHLRFGKDAVMRLRLTIDRTGRVTDCAIQNEAFEKPFEIEICRNYRKIARFEPALDSSGNPVKSHYSTAVTFISR